MSFQESAYGLLSRAHLSNAPRGLIYAGAIVAILALVLVVANLQSMFGSQGVSFASEASQEARSDAVDGTDTGESDEVLDGDQDSQSENGEGASSYEGDEEGMAPVCVDVDGAVANPGVYTLVSGSRVDDAITMAGGLAENADTSSVNLASRIEDGQKIYIPEEGEEPQSSNVSDDSPSGSGSASASDGKVNINTADAQQLETLDGIGEVMAQRIIEEREANGSFESVDDLTRVSGIGEKKLAQIIDSICV